MSFTVPQLFDVLVIGGGHAGVEAALAAARLGGRVALVTHDLDSIGQMSCNPAIGGLAKGHIVREIDALGGAMGLNTDATALQFRMLNASKGPSVRAPRAQCDKAAYRMRMKWVVETTPGVQLFQGEAREIITEKGRVIGIETVWGLRICSRSVVLCSGTFMRGLLHVGMEQQPGGVLGDLQAGFLLVSLVWVFLSLGLKQVPLRVSRAALLISLPVKCSRVILPRLFLVTFLVECLLAILSPTAR